MDKVTLTPEQIKELKNFIYARGFREPEVMMEVLDHFACKVEDKLLAEPNLDLNTAMREAHTEFGYNGFYSIKVSLDVFTRRKYKRLYWQEVKRIVTSVPYLLLIILIGFGTYFGMMWAYTNNIYDSFFDMNIVSVIILCSMIISELVKVFLLFRNINNKSYYLNMANTVNYGSLFVFWVFFPTGKMNSEKQMVVASIVAACMCSYYFLYYIARYRMQMAAYKDYKEFLSFNEESLR